MKEDRAKGRRTTGSRQLKVIAEIYDWQTVVKDRASYRRALREAMDENCSEKPAKKNKNININTHHSIQGERA
jgi:hypothetical protein